MLTTKPETNCKYKVGNIPETAPHQEFLKVIWNNWVLFNLNTKFQLLYMSKSISKDAVIFSLLTKT